MFYWPRTLTRPQASVPEVRSEMHVKMAKIDYPVGQAEGKAKE